jgi:hypothetical protein
MNRQARLRAQARPVAGGADPAEALAPPDQTRWRAYLELRAGGQRRAALAALGELLAAVRAYPEPRRRAWAVALSRARWDEGHLATLPYPLLEQVVAPELRRGVAAGEPDALRWAGAALRRGDVPSRRARALVGRDALDAEALLREALAADPDDARARGELLALLARWFEYAVHELPTGLLADPEAFLRELDDFERLCAAQGTARYTEALRGWRFHGEAWADYERRRAAFRDYPDYLARVHGAAQEGLELLVAEYRSAADWPRLLDATTRLLALAPAADPRRGWWHASRARAALALGDLARAEADLSALRTALLAERNSDLQREAAALRTALVARRRPEPPRSPEPR